MSEESWVVHFGLTVGLLAAGIGVLFGKDWMVKRVRQGHPVIPSAITHLIGAVLAMGLILFVGVVVIEALSHSSCGNNRDVYTRVLMQRLGMGLNKYYGTYRVFPAESAMTDSSRSTSIYRFLCPAGGTPLTDFNDGEVRDFNGTWWVVDAWGHQIVYCAPSGTEAEVGNFRLFSPGKNGIEGDTDDIVLTKIQY